MIAGMSAFASNAAVTSDESVSAGNYYNANYLESYASKAYNESGLGSVYSKTSTTWKTWSPDASSVSSSSTQQVLTTRRALRQSAPMI